MMATLPRSQDGKFAGQVGLTTQQQRFVDCFIANGGNAKKAAEAAGYQHPASEGWRLTNTPSVAEAIKKTTLGMALAGGTVGMNTLLAVAQDAKAPAAARVNAAIGLCRVAGLLGDNGVSLIQNDDYAPRHGTIDFKRMLQDVRQLYIPDTSDTPIPIEGH